MWHRSEGKERPVYVETYERSVVVAPARSRGAARGAKGRCADGGPLHNTGGPVAQEECVSELKQSLRFCR